MVKTDMLGNRWKVAIQVTVIISAVVFSLVMWQLNKEAPITSGSLYAYDLVTGTAQRSLSPFAKYSFDSNVPKWEGGFGRRVLGECWVAHHGQHGVEGSRGVIEPASVGHPILRSVAVVFGPSDVYAVRDLSADTQILLRGQVTSDLTSASAAVADGRNTAMMPLVWLQRYRVEDGPEGQALCSTIGAAVDFVSADLRRLFINACYVLTGLSERIRTDSEVDPVTTFQPSWFGLGGWIRER